MPLSNEEATVTLFFIGYVFGMVTGVVVMVLMSMAGFVENGQQEDWE